MQHLPSPELARRALRATICPVCYQRPPHSESLTPAVPRSCEPACPVFRYAEDLRAIVHDLSVTNTGDVPGAADRAVRERICNGRCGAPGAGDCCPDALAEVCPLSRFAEQAVAVLQAMQQVSRASHRALERGQEP